MGLTINGVIHLDYVLLGDVSSKRRNSLNAELSVVHTPGHGKRISLSNWIIIKHQNCFFGILGVAVSDVAIGPVSSTKFNHQSQFIKSSHRLENWNQLVFKAISWDSVAIYLGSSIGSRSWHNFQFITVREDGNANDRKERVKNIVGIYHLRLSLRVMHLQQRLTFTKISIWWKIPW